LTTDHDHELQTMAIAQVQGSETAERRPPGLLALSIGSLGVVYGDIGTSPLYALKEALTSASNGRPVTVAAIYGVVSLILWTLTIIVTIKYVLFLLRADNHGEGGTLTLMALAQRAAVKSFAVITVLGMLGAALFYGDAVITPAISVLSAVEGLKVVSPEFDALVVPLSLAVLIALFVVQSRGTAKVAAFFGPIMVLWFVAIALGGLYRIVQEPAVLQAINPAFGVRFLLSHGWIGFFTLGAVFLAVTGAEALYADLGHFGRKPIQLAWLGMVFPALALNYLGQGALLLQSPEKLENPFYLVFPDGLELPMVFLATVATVIASQAVISGAYSLTSQAIQLRLLPRFEIRRTSETLAGQIYMPRVNMLLLVLVLLLVGVFKSSSALAAAYGVSVTGTMVITSLMAFTVVLRCWHWSVYRSAALVLPLLAVDLVFLLANLAKVLEGGWIPLLIGGSLLTVMVTWRRGTAILQAKTRRTEVPLGVLLASLEKKPPHIVPGTAVFLTSDPEFAPTALLHNLKHNKVLHERNVILTIVTASTPRVKEAERVKMTQVSERFNCVELHFGYMESPNIPKALAIARKLGWHFDIMSTSFFLSRRALKPAAQSGMPRWQDRLFIALAKSASDATDFFQIPTGRVVEVGTQVAV
jgi:KUP system potassium uptake protein